MIYMVDPVVLLLWLLASWIIGEWGRHKRLGFFGNFLVSLVFSPVVGVIVVLVSVDRPRPVRRGRIVKTTRYVNNPPNRT